jgi:beta-phosphoglucomutase-like phosphatase (HAD superfamily)
MAALGVAPEACVAIEDSVAGASSALAAGAVVLGVPGMQPLPPLAGLVLRDTLAGLRPADLAALLRRRPAGPAEDPAA